MSQAPEWMEWHFKELAVDSVAPAQCPSGLPQVLFVSLCPDTEFLSWASILMGSQQQVFL